MFYYVYLDLFKFRQGRRWATIFLVEAHVFANFLSYWLVVNKYINTNQIVWYKYTTIWLCRDPYDTLLTPRHVNLQTRWYVWIFSNLQTHVIYRLLEPQKKFKMKSIYNVFKELWTIYIKHKNYLLITL